MQRRSGCSGTFQGDSANGLSDQLWREMSKGGSGWRRWSDNEEVHLNLDLDRESWSPWNNTIVLDLWTGTMRGHTQRTYYFPAQRRTCAQIHFEWAAKIARSEYGAQWEKFRFCNCDFEHLFSNRFLSDLSCNYVFPYSSHFSLCDWDYHCMLSVTMIGTPFFYTTNKMCKLKEVLGSNIYLGDVDIYLSMSNT